jgi:hypothetical protein
MTDPGNTNGPYPDPRAAWYTIEDVCGEARTAEQQFTLMWLGRRAAQYTRDAGLTPGAVRVTGRPYDTVGCYPGWAIGEAWLDWQREHA